MPSFASSALRLLRRVLGNPARDGAPYAGSATPLDGNTAIALTETAISEGAGLGASYPSDTAELAWRAQPAEHNGPGVENPWRHAAAGPRGALETAIGLCLSGVRTTAFLSSSDLVCAQDLLTSAVGRHLPLVIHLGNRALPGHATAMGSGHEAVHAIADSGCFMLFAANVQEAIDFTLIARRVAEMTLTPGVVIMDGEQTALATQDARLPTGELLTRFVGAADDMIPSATTSQNLLFGENRRRLPRWHDLDHPSLLGGIQSTKSWGLGKVADEVFDADHLAGELATSIRRLADLTGRVHQGLSSHRIDDASLVLVAQGAAIETAEAVADHLRSAHRVRVGVLGLRVLRPFPGGRLVETLGGREQVLVLERASSPAGDVTPLSRELQAAFQRAQQNVGRQTPLYPGYPALSTADCPDIRSVLYGIGGLPLRGADLIALCTGTRLGDLSQVYLGVAFSRVSSPYPKRQVILDRLRREYPDIGRLGLIAESATPDLRPPGALSLAIHRIAGETGAGLGTEAAALLRASSQGQLRSHPDLSPEPWGGYCVDRFTWAPADLRDPGDQMPIDLLVLLAEARPVHAQALDDLPEDGLLLLEDAGPGTDLPPELVAMLRRGRFNLYRVAPLEPQQQAGAVPAEARGDYLLGAIFGVLLDAGLLDAKPRRLLSLHEQLSSPSAAERAARTAAFQAGIERVHRLDRANLRSAPEPDNAVEEEAPMVVRKLHGGGQTYHSLPRFWDQVGVLYRHGESGQLSPDPFMASGAVPALSSAFRDLSPLRQMLPEFDPALCTGCGACWTQCPDGAVGAVAQTPAAVLEAAINQFGAQALRPLATKLAARIANRCGDSASTSFGELLQEASAWLQDRMPLPADRREGVASAASSVNRAFGGLPLVATEPFFPSTGNGSGELLFLAINPAACKGCGICTSACEPHALTPAAQSRKALQQARETWGAWERLPDTPPTVRERVGADPEIGSLAATLLSRDHTASLAGGDAAEPGSGERLALRLLMAVVESRQRPLVADFVREIHSTKEGLSGLIRETLTGALPADDLDALASSLEKVETQQAELSDFLSDARFGTDGGIDARRLRRLVHLVKGLENLAVRLSNEHQGPARARMGIVLTSGSVSRWAGVFPHNPFATPVTVDLSTSGPQLAIGLLQGQLRQSTDGFRLMRRARLELEHPEEASRAPADTHLGWQELTPEEQAICPPLVVVCGDELLRGAGLSQLDKLLGSDLPIKVLVLSELDLGLATRAGLDIPLGASDDPGLDLAVLALARRGACIAQTSIAMPEHLMNCLETALASPGPALLHLHAPSPLRHGFDTDAALNRARLAVESRLFPLFLYDPAADGVFGSRLSLDGNPEPRSPWAGTDAQQGPLTPASWALGERRFATCFTPPGDDDPESIGVADYLALEEQERHTRTPVVQADGEAAGTVRYKVAPGLMRICRARQQSWQMLQEIAGLVTPFTARVQQEARDRVAADHEAELAALRADYEARIAALEGEMLEKTREEMRERMMRLAGYVSGGSGREGGSL